MCYVIIIVKFIFVYLYLLYFLRYRRFYRQVDIRKNRQTNRWTNKQEDRRTDRSTDRRMNRQTDGQGNLQRDNMDRQTWVNRLLVLLQNIYSFQTAHAYYAFFSCRKISIKSMVKKWKSQLCRKLCVNFFFITIFIFLQLYLFGPKNQDKSKMK